MDLDGPPGQPPHPGLAPDPNEDADMDQMNGAPDEDDAGMPTSHSTFPTVGMLQAF